MECEENVRGLRSQAGRVSRGHAMEELVGTAAKFGLFFPLKDVGEKLKGFK